MVAALVPADTECRLRRAQLGLVAVVAGTCLVSIFAAQLAFALACAFFLARLALRGAAFPRLPLDGPTLAFSVWTLLAASFSRNPLGSHEESKKLLLFLLLYLAVETLSTEEARERVVKADIERSLLDPWRDLPTSGGDVDPDTGEIKEG